MREIPEAIICPSNSAESIFSLVCCLIWNAPMQAVSSVISSKLIPFGKSCRINPLDFLFASLSYEWHWWANEILIPSSWAINACFVNSITLKVVMELAAFLLPMAILRRLPPNGWLPCPTVSSSTENSHYNILVMRNKNSHICLNF